MKENYVEEYQSIAVFEDFTKVRKVEIFLGEATDKFVVNLTENGEWSDGVFVTLDRQSAFQAAFNILNHGI